MESRPLKDDAGRRNKALDMPLALGTVFQRFFGDPLLDLEDISAF
jgi:hypothetical protein